MQSVYVSALLLVMVCWRSCNGHGYLLDPPSRSTRWREDPSAPANYDDNALWCGGFQHQQSQNGRCGVCGDAWDLPTPRPNESGGTFANPVGVVTRTYSSGQTITAVVKLTANHAGWFEFRLCPEQRESQACLDRHLLEVAGQGTRFQLPDRQARNYQIQLKLPAGVTCDHCVMQWKYNAGNNWYQGGPDNGPQEQFYGCADVKIGAGAARMLEQAPQARHPQGGQNCVAAGAWAGDAGITGWCVDNCARGFCPASHCRCS